MLLSDNESIYRIGAEINPELAATDTADTEGEMSILNLQRHMEWAKIVCRNTRRQERKWITVRLRMLHTHFPEPADRRRMEKR